MASIFDKRIFWVHWMGRVVGENTIDELADTVKLLSPNVSGIAIKTNDGADWQGRYDTDTEMAINGPDDILNWAKRLARKGLKTYMWAVVRGRDVDEEAKNIALACRVRGVQAMILDVEVGESYFGGQTAETARRLINKIRNAAPNNFHIALSFDARGTHPQNIHIDEWIPHVNSLHPQVYHWHFSEGTRGPKTYLDETFRVLAKYNLPIVPMLQAYNDPSSGTRVPESQITEAGDYSFQKGAEGVSYFRLGSAGPAEFRGVSKINADPTQPPPRQTKEYLVTPLVLNVRTEPSVDARSLVPGEQLRQGERINVYTDSRAEKSGFVWWEHKTGWSAERTTDNKEVYLVDVNQPLPPPDFLFERLPVKLSDQQWLYYYGNTVFAYLYGRQNNYHGYSQGLHGGLDFGHRGGIDIVAGVHGTFDYSGSGKSFGPNRVDILLGDYLIIYGHVAKPISLPRGAPVTPDTVIGKMDFGAQHMHLEIRYQNEQYILNPFLFMSATMRNQLMAKFPPQNQYAFYTSTRWTRWDSPLDQPTIIRGGPVIGPTA